MEFNSYYDAIDYVRDVMSYNYPFDNDYPLDDDDRRAVRSYLDQYSGYDNSFRTERDVLATGRELSDNAYLSVLNTIREDILEDEPADDYDDDDDYFEDYDEYYDDYEDEEDEEDEDDE